MVPLAHVDVCGCCGLFFGPVGMRLHLASSRSSGFPSAGRTPVKPASPVAAAPVLTPPAWTDSEQVSPEHTAADTAGQTSSPFMNTSLDMIPTVSSAVFSPESRHGSFAGARSRGNLRTPQEALSRSQNQRDAPATTTSDIVHQSMHLARDSIAKGHVPSIPLERVGSIHTAHITVATSGKDLQGRRNAAARVTEPAPEMRRGISFVSL
jgi:hypothetical protein